MLFGTPADTGPFQGFTRLPRLLRGNSTVDWGWGVGGIEDGLRAPARSTHRRRLAVVVFVLNVRRKKETRRDSGVSSPRRRQSRVVVVRFCRRATGLKSSHPVHDTNGAANERRLTRGGLEGGSSDGIRCEGRSRHTERTLLCTFIFDVK